MKNKLKNTRLPIGTGNGDKRKKNIEGWRSVGMEFGEEHATWWWKLQDECMNAATSSSPKAHKMRLWKGDQISQSSLSIWVEFLFINYQILNLQEPNLSIYNRRGLKWKANEIQKFPPNANSNGRLSSHEANVINFLFSAPPKVRLHPLMYSHFYLISTPTKLYKRNYKKSHHLMLFTQCSSHAPSDPLGFGPFLGLGFMGLSFIYLVSIILPGLERIRLRILKTYIKGS